MKKTIFSLLLIIAMSLTLVSCFGGDDGSTPPPLTDDVTVVSRDVTPTVIMSSTAASAEMTAATELASALSTLYGIKVTTATDVTEQSTPEIAIGRTDRAASTYACDYVRANAADGGEGLTYLICYREGTLAIAASSPDALNAAVSYFVTELCAKGPVVVKEGFEIFFNKSVDEINAEKIAALKAAELAGWEDRWQECEDILGEDTVESLKRLYSIFGADMYTWMANLWDPDTGAFYYSNSARDNYPFLPDVESTYQVINAIRASGMLNIYADFYDCDTTKALELVLPTEMREGIINFVREMQSEDDGYFYHIQWGSSIKPERRGRDLRWATQLLTWLGGTPKYPTALDRLEQNSGTAAIIRNMMRDLSEVRGASYLDSKEALIAYVDSLNLTKDSHNAGNKLAAQMYEIESAGLLDELLDYFDELQRKNYEEMAAAHKADPENNPAPNGLWQKEVNYTSVSGLMKLGAIYNRAGRPINYVSECVNSCIEAALSDTNPNWVIYIYNPWAALGPVVSLARKANTAAAARGDEPFYDLDPIYELVYGKAKEMLDKTVEKLLLFRKDDGSYSYYQNQSADTTQGTYVSLGLNEGDVNAAYCAFQTISYIFSAFNIDRPAVWSATDLDAFLEIVESSSSIVKNAIDPKVEIDFEDCEEGEIPSGVTVGIVDSGTVKDPVRENNMVFRHVSPLNTKGDTMGVDVFHGLGSVACYDYSMDLMMEEGINGYSHQITFGGRSSDSEVYMLTLTIANGKVTIGDASSISSTRVWNSFGSVAIGEWFNLRVKIFAGESPSDFNVKIYLNGTCIAISKNFYGSHEADAIPRRTVDYVKIYSMMKITSTLLVDNIKSAPDNDATFDDSDLGGTAASAPAGRYDFEEYNKHFNATHTYPGSYSEITNDPQNADNKVYKISKSNGDGGYTPDIYQFNNSTVTGKKFVLSMNVYFDNIRLSEPDANFRHVYQIAVGDFNNANTVYTLLFFYDRSGNILVGDTNDTAKNTTFHTYDFVFKQNQWYTVSLEIDLSADPESFLAKISVDGTEVATSKNYYNQSTSGRVPSVRADKIDLRPMRRCLGDIYLDDVTLSCSD